MSSRRLVLVACLTCLTVGSPADLLAGEPAIMFPGEFHGDEVPASSGETWLALVQGSGGLDQLAPVVLQVETVVDEMVDEDGSATGRRVSPLGNHGSILFLVRDVQGVRQGKVETVTGEIVLEPDSPVSLALAAGPTSELELRCQAPQLVQEWEEVTCSLVFSRGRREQILKSYDASYHNGRFDGLGNSAFARIVWAGDLNGDAQLDLVVDLTDHYNVELPTLFLSPESNDTKLLVRIADHRSVGC